MRERREVSEGLVNGISLAAKLHTQGANEFGRSGNEGIMPDTVNYPTADSANAQKSPRIQRAKTLGCGDVGDAIGRRNDGHGNAVFAEQRPEHT